MKKTTSVIALCSVLWLFLFAGCAATVVEKTLPHPDSIVSPPLNFEPPRADRIELDNGMVLFFMEDREVPLVDLSLVTRAGSVYDPKGLEGLARMTGSAMRSGGTRHMTPHEVDDELDFLAADIGVSVDAEVLTISLNAPRETFDRAFELFGEIMMHPRFCEDRLATTRNVTLENLKRLPDNPQRLAFRELSQVLYDDDRWGRSPTITSVKAIDRDHLRSFHERYVQSGPAMIALSGAISAEEIVEKLNAFFASRPLEEVEPLPEPPISRESAPNYYLARQLPQSVVITGYLAPGKTSSRYYAMEVLNTIAGGGGFQSRLMTEIRTRRGLAYSAGSLYQSRTYYGVFAAYAMTRSDATVTVVDLTDSILADFIHNPVDEETLSQARQSLTNSYVFSFTSARMVAEGQMMNEFSGLPHDFLHTYTEGINAVTAGDVQKAAESYLNEDRRVLLVLGDPAYFKEELSSKGPLLEVRSDLLEEIPESTEKEDGQDEPETY